MELLKLVYFENENIRIEINNNELSFESKSSAYEKDQIDYAISIYKYIERSLNKINEEVENGTLEKTGNICSQCKQID